MSDAAAATATDDTDTQPVPVVTAQPEPAPRIRIALVDDQDLFVYGMRMLVESQSDLELIGTAADGEGAVELVVAERPDVVLMDIRMPGLNGIAATRRILEAAPYADETGPRPRIVMLTTFRQDEAVLQAMHNGASAYVTKDATPEMLLDTIRAVHAGDAPAMPVGRIARGAAPTTEPSELPPRPDLAIAALSPREREIFLLAAKGLRNSEIAAAAFVSEATVKTHVRNVLAKLELTSRAQIVVFAYEHRLVTG